MRKSLCLTLEPMGRAATFNEPLSFLQKLCEPFQFKDLLDKGASESSPAKRLAYVAAFVVAGYSLTVNRMRKPFNPLLGETFEFEDKEMGLKFVGEQVSHHPPISACYVQTDNFESWANSCIKTKMGASSMEIITKGTVYTHFPKTGDRFEYERIPSSLKNLLWGTPFIETIGELPIKNTQNGLSCLIKFLKKDKKQKNQIEASVSDAEGRKILELFSTDGLSLFCRDLESGAESLLWEATPLGENAKKQFFFSKFTLQLNYLNEELAGIIPPTDSRFRPDQRAIELGENEFANKEKLRLEESQRAREKAHKYQPRFFNEQEEMAGSKSKDEHPTFVFNNTYWLRPKPSPEQEPFEQIFM